MQTDLLLQEIVKPKYFQQRKVQEKCLICKKLAKYICPKCKIYYCNLQCYQQHNEDCTELFYQQNVEQELKNIKQDPKNIKKMQQILLDMHQNEQFNEDVVQEQENQELNQQQIERLEQILIQLKSQKDSFDFSSLSQKEYQQFLQFVNQSQEIENYLIQWKGYWEYDQYVPSLKIIEMNEDNDKFNIDQMKSKKENKVYLKRQQIIKELKNYSQINPDKINNNIIYHLTNIIYSIVLMLRYFNGKQEEMNSLHFILENSNCILKYDGKIIINSAKKAIQLNLNMIKDESILDYHKQIMHDLTIIFSNKIFVIELLFQFQDLIIAYFKLDQPLLSSQIINQLKFKSAFLISLMKYLQEDSLKQLQEELQGIYQQLL